MKLIRLAMAMYLTSCADMGNTPEVIDKLRTLGVGKDQAAYTYSTEAATVTAGLTFYLASNTKTDITASSIASTSTYNYQELSNINITYDDYTELRLYKVTATVTIPTLEELKFSVAEKGTAVIYYALKFSQGAGQDLEEEQVRGTLRIYRPEKATATVPTINITFPEADATVALGTVNLKAETTTDSTDFNRIGWFVASGNIEKRGAVEAEWKEMTAGTKTIIATIRGVTSTNFSYQVIEANLE